MKQNMQQQNMQQIYKEQEIFDLIVYTCAHNKIWK